MGQQRPKQAAVCRDAEVEQFVYDDKILKARLLFHQVFGDGDRAGGRAGTPFPGHTLHSNNPCFGFQTLRPVSNSLMEAFTSVVTRFHQTGRRE